MKLRPSINWIFFAAFFIVSCKNISVTHEGEEFYYYPSKNVYYDVGRSNFLFSLDSGKTWDSLYSEKAAPAIEGSREIVYSTEAPVWKNNEAHRNSFNGTLLNIINEESLKVPEPVAEKKSVRKTSNDEADTDSEKSKKKRPVKRFFQKLFGKKK
ncbi:MAG: hypothetical protein V4717_15240 [Bacteroidota bacterium]